MVEGDMPRRCCGAAPHVTRRTIAERRPALASKLIRRAELRSRRSSARRFGPLLVAHAAGAEAGGVEDVGGGDDVRLGRHDRLTAATTPHYFHVQDGLGVHGATVHDSLTSARARPTMRSWSTRSTAASSMRNVRLVVVIVPAA